MTIHTKRWIALLSMLAMLCALLPLGAISTVAADTNLLTNGSFEQGFSGWTAQGGTALCDDPHSGTQAVRLTHTAAWGEALTRTVEVKSNTEYTFSFWVKRDSGSGVWNAYALDPNKGYQLIPLTKGENWFSATSKQWQQMSFRFHSGSRTSVFLKFCPETDNSGTILVDDLSLTVAGDDPPPPPTTEEPLTLTSFGALNNRPLTEKDNLIKGGDFVSSSGASWNTTTFLSKRVTMVKDSTCADGYALHFNTSGTKEEERHIFWVTVKPNTEYVFSVWLKGAYLSSASVGRATVGVVDPDTETFLVHKSTEFSTEDRQLVPTAWDGQWHLRSVSFNSGKKTRIGIAVQGYGTKLWLDDMALYPQSRGKKYISPAVDDSFHPITSTEETGCTAENNLIKDSHLDADTDFWQSGTGWKNGFLTISESPYEYGNSLRYSASADAVGVQYVKWITIKANTEYTFSADLKILREGGGSLILLDGKKRDALKVMEVEFSQSDYGEDWFEVVYRFNSASFTTVGIGIVDGGGRALLDNLRLFESRYRTAVTDPYVELPPGVEDPNDTEDPIDPEDPTEPDSPADPDAPASPTDPDAPSSPDGDAPTDGAPSKGDTDGGRDNALLGALSLQKEHLVLGIVLYVVLAAILAAAVIIPLLLLRKKKAAAQPAPSPEDTPSNEDTPSA